MASNVKNWKEDVLQQLKKRNKQQTSSYASLILANNKLLEITGTLKGKNAQLQAEQDQLKAENFQLAVKADSG
ncbi:hypothetical protein V1264_010394 [Littorina saxatilis]|uniref:Uncharacterized protein n=2 Tax=Littorina saxatilis TaxID=31220 RepID=A0AAN9APU9_9CAEN